MRRPSRRVEIILAVALAAVTIAVYAPVRSHAFLNYDDPDYVTENPHVTAGLTWQGVAWAFTANDKGNWIPVTWLSHMADVSLFGVASGPHHITSATLHALSAALLFGLLVKLTGARWRSLFVAAIFALHPLHVESVAWLSERKDVLSALFWFVTIWAYLRHVERPSRGRYIAVIVSFALGLMSKSMIVTLPVVLLLLDYWPLGRWERAPATRTLVIEKLPLVALSVVIGIVTVLLQTRGGGVASLETVPLLSRLAHAIITPLVYLKSFVWPIDLAVLYPYDEHLSVWLVAGSAIAIVVTTIAAVRAARRAPYFLVGWMWYLVTLLPVIGLIQVGAQSHADRYTYVPMIGISIAAAWGLADLSSRSAAVRIALSAGTVAALVAIAFVTSAQLSYWRDSESLFSRAIDVTTDNYVAHNNLGDARRESGRVDAALVQFREAIRLRPTYAEAQANAGEALVQLGRAAEALPYTTEAVRLAPALRSAHLNRAAALVALGQPNEAIVEYEALLKTNAGDSAALTGLGAVLAAIGRSQEAVQRMREAIRLRPDSLSYFNLGTVYADLGQIADARTAFAEAVRLNPNDARAHSSYGTSLANTGDLDGAIREYRAAIRLEPGNARAHSNLGSALAAQGLYDPAIAEFSDAVRLKPDFEEARRNLAVALSLRGKKGGG